MLQAQRGQRLGVIQEEVADCLLGYAYIDLRGPGAEYQVNIRPYFSRPLDDTHVKKLRAQIENGGLQDLTYPLVVAVDRTQVNLHRMRLKPHEGAPKLTFKAQATEQTVYLLNGQHRVQAARQIALDCASAVEDHSAKQTGDSSGYLESMRSRQVRCEKWLAAIYDYGTS